jgi:glutamate racemase
VGGVSILQEIHRLAPVENLIYLADSAGCPYGTKPPEEIRRRSQNVNAFLDYLGVKAIEVSCNTACEAGLNQIRAEYPHIPVIEIEPGVKPAVQITQKGRIGVLATPLTLAEKRFAEMIERFENHEVRLFACPAPGLVELVEAGLLEGAEAETTVRLYLEPLLQQGIDTLVLGCTHYPFLRPVIERICGPANHPGIGTAGIAKPISIRRFSGLFYHWQSGSGS